MSVNVGCELAAADPAPRLALASPPPPPALRAGLLPPEQLTLLLVHYRRFGVSFDTAWEQALERVRWPSSRRDASEWRTSVNGTREGWRACYMGWAPLPHERAVGQLAVILRTIVA